MNIQAMMKQAQKLQKDMMVAKEEIDNKIFPGKSSFVKVEVMGNKKVKKISFDVTQLEAEDIEILGDLVLVAINEAMDKIDKETEEKLGKYTQGMPGLF